MAWYGENPRLDLQIGRACFTSATLQSSLDIATVARLEASFTLKRTWKFLTCKTIAHKTATMINGLR